MHRELGALGLEDDTIFVTFVGKPNLASPAAYSYRAPPLGEGPTHVKPGMRHSAETGLWVVRGRFATKNAEELVLEVFTPRPIVQLNDTGLCGLEAPGCNDVSVVAVIDSIGVYDPIADAPADDSGSLDHRFAVAFHVSSGTNHFVIRAKPKREKVVLDPGHEAFCLEAACTATSFQREEFDGVVEDIVTVPIAESARAELEMKGMWVFLTRTDPNFQIQD